MKIIESYNDISLDKSSKQELFKVIHTKTHQSEIEKLLPVGTSVWIDSGVKDCSNNMIAFENEKWKDIFEPHTSTKFYRNLTSPTLAEAIKKYIGPTSVVMYESEEFRYVTTSELINKIKYLVDALGVKLILYVDTITINYNKLKYSPTHIIDHVKKSVNQNMIVHKIDQFKYIFEIN